MLLLTKKWDAIRASGCDLGHFGALDGVHVGQTIDRDKVLVRRGQELIGPLLLK